MRGTPARHSGSKTGGGGALTPALGCSQHAAAPLADKDYDENGARLMSRKVVQQVLRSSGSFVTPQYNTTLYLNSMMFSSIQGLEEFTGLKVLHLECNAIKKIQGLQHMTQLKALYLQSNDISQLEGLEACTQLEHLNISGNPVMVLDGLPPSLGTLHASSVGLSSDEQIARLADMCPALQVLDVSRNRLPASALPMLCRLLQLRVLYCKDNPCTQAPSYRRRLVSSLPQLSYLDDSPVDDMERRGAEAWVVGGSAAEREARLAWREERRRALRRSTTTFAVERAQRRILRELSGLVGSDEQLSLLLQLLDSPLHQDSAQALVSQILGEQHPATVLPEALDVLPTGRYQRDAPTCLLMAPHMPATEGPRGPSGDAEGPVAPTGAAEPHPGSQPPPTGCAEEGKPASAAGGGAPAPAQECVVCSEELEEGASVMWLPCSHLFHEACIRQWLTGFSSTCPTCRAKVLAPAAPVSPTVHPAAGPGAPEAGEEALPSPTASGQLLAAALGGRPGPAGPVASALSANRITLSILSELAASLAAPRLAPAPGPLGPDAGLPSAPPSPGTDPLAAAQCVLEALAAAAAQAPPGPLSSAPDAGNPAPSTPAAGPSAAGTAGLDVPAVAGCAEANSMEDPTYQKLQQMYRHNFGQKSKAAESLLGGWNSIKESRRKEMQGSQQQQQQQQEPEGEALASQPSIEHVEVSLSGTAGGHALLLSPSAPAPGAGAAPTAAAVRNPEAGGAKSEWSQELPGGGAQPSQAVSEPLTRGEGDLGCGQGGGAAGGGGSASVGQAPVAPTLVQARGAKSRVASAPRPESARAAAPAAAAAAAPAWRREVSDSPVQSVLQAVSRVMQQRHGQAPGAPGAPPHAAAPTEPRRASGAAFPATRQGEQRPGSGAQKQKHKLGPSLSVGHLVDSEGGALGDEDPWELPTGLQAPSVPYL